MGSENIFQDCGQFSDTCKGNSYNNKNVLHHAMIEEGFDLLAIVLTQEIDTYPGIRLFNMIKWVK